MRNVLTICISSSNLVLYKQKKDVLTNSHRQNTRTVCLYGYVLYHGKVRGGETARYITMIVIYHQAKAPVTDST